MIEVASILLYVLLFVFVLIAILLKIKQRQKVHFLWFLTLGVLTIIPLILFTFISGAPVITVQ